MQPDYQPKQNTRNNLAEYSYLPRIFAYFCGLAVVLIVFNERDSQYLDNTPLMLLLFSICIFWPHISYLWAIRSKATNKIIFGSIIFDSFFGGIWAPLMSFEILPCIVFIATLTMNNISAGGYSAFAKGTLAMLTAIAISSYFSSPTINLESSFTVLLITLPMILIFPIAMAVINFKLSRALIKQRKKLITISRHDALTGLYNRRYWEKRLLEEFSRCQRSKENACVMMVDIDHFKKINDNFGHLVGDNVLKMFGSILKELRASDIPGRYGGEEFSILLPNSTLDESLLVAERLRLKIENSEFEKVGRCTVSIGVAFLEEDYGDAYKWLDNADRALYQAKKEGRNRTAAWS